MDDLTFRQLKESNYYHPEIIDVVFDSRMMLEMVIDSINISEIGFDTVWDEIMFYSMWKYFQEGIHLVEKQIKEKGIKLRLIVEVTPNNFNHVSSLDCPEISHLDNIRGNRGIFDKRAYMVYIFHKENELPD